jgi:hypothetical protein
MALLKKIRKVRLIFYASNVEHHPSSQEAFGEAFDNSLHDLSVLGCVELVTITIDNVLRTAERTTWVLAETNKIFAQGSRAGKVKVQVVWSG